MEIIKHRLASRPLADAVAVERVAVVGRLFECGSERERDKQSEICRLKTDFPSFLQHKQAYGHTVGAVLVCPVKMVLATGLMTTWKVGTCMISA